MEPVTREELAARMEDGLVTVLDVRPEDEFEAGHLPHAINTPLRELAQQLRRLPKDREIVAYCHGHSASLPSKRWRCCAKTASGPAAWRMDFRNGRRRACPSDDRMCVNR